MTKKIFLTIGAILLLIIISIFYLSTVGIETTKFNKFIKKEIKQYNNKSDIILKKVKLKLNLDNLFININTFDPVVTLNSTKIPLEKLNFSISIKSYLNKEFGIKKASIETKYNKINKFIDIYQSENGSVQFYILSRMLKDGEIKFKVDLEFDPKGKLKKNFIIYGNIKEAKINISNDFIFDGIKFDFEFKKNSYELTNTHFNFNNVDFNSNKILIKNKNEYYKVKADVKNKNGILNNKILSILLKEYQKFLNIENSKISSNSNFSFDIIKDFKIRNLKATSNIRISEFRYLSKYKKIKKYLPRYEGQIYFRNNEIDINYSKNNYELIVSSKYSLNNLTDDLNFKIKKLKDLYNFNFDISLENNRILLEELNYLKKQNKKSKLKMLGEYNKNKELVFKKINLEEKKNNFNVENLIISKNFKIVKFDKIVNSYLSKDKIQNNYSIIFRNQNYILSGTTYDGIKLLDNMFESDNENFFDIFENLNNKIVVDLNQLYIDQINYLYDVRASIELNKNKIKNLVLDSNISKDKELKLTINTTKNGEKITTVFSDYPRPLVGRYKFIKGFEKGILDFQSIKKKNISKSVLKIDNFKVKEVPALAKLLSLASLQGIADTLTGEGIRFTDFEMIFSNENNLMTIEEIYAIGPAISILMEGYIEKNNLISLRGTLVPAGTKNRTISSIPFIGDILVGKKVGEGVFGVSFKIKGPPKALKTTVNPIKTLTPRFITRTLEKLKKN